MNRSAIAMRRLRPESALPTGTRPVGGDQVALFSRRAVSSLRRGIGWYCVVGMIGLGLFPWPGTAAPPPTSAAAERAPAAPETSPAATPGKDGKAKPTPADKAKNDEYYELLDLFVDTLDQVERNYVRDISRRELVEAAIQGMLARLDQHTNYISPKELDQFKTGVESEFGGIGIHVVTRNGELNISGAVVDSPAYRAKLTGGDVITDVEGKSLRGLPIEDCIRLLKGKPGTTVEITVRHGKDNQTETLKLTREIVRMETVVGFTRQPDNTWNYWLDKDQKIAYVRLVSFSRHTTDEMRKSLVELTAGDMRGLVLDLRFNPGGLLSSAIEICDLFVSEGRIVSTSGRNVTEKAWDAHRRGTYEGFPMVVLLNRASASASEIVAACLQDHQRAVVAGERSWGKGSVQNVVELEGGHSALKLTTAKYFRPSGKDIHRDENEGEDDEWGVQPDTGLGLRYNVRQLHELSAQLAQQMQLHSDGVDGATEALFRDEQLTLARNYLVESLGKASAAAPKPEAVSPPKESK